MSFGPKDADAWYERNKHKLGAGDDPVLKALPALSAHSRVLEIGCANGWRLEAIKKRFGCNCWGMEISPLACQDVNKNVIILNKEPAIATVDLIILGFFLYVFSPGGLLRMASECDQFLKDGGHIIMHDFLPDYPYSRIFEHNTELRSRKMDHAQLWLGHPAYNIVHRDVYGEQGSDGCTHVTILKKNMKNAFPLKEV